MLGADFQWPSLRRRNKLRQEVIQTLRSAGPGTPDCSRSPAHPSPIPSSFSHLSSQQKLCLRAAGGGVESLVSPQPNACISLNRCFWHGAQASAFTPLVMGQSLPDLLLNPATMKKSEPHSSPCDFPILNLPSGVAQHLGFLYLSPTLLPPSQFPLLPVVSASVPLDSLSCRLESVISPSELPGSRVP